MKSSATFLLSMLLSVAVPAASSAMCACSMRSGRQIERPFGNCCRIMPMSMPLSLTVPPRWYWRLTAMIWKWRTF